MTARALSLAILLAAAAPNAFADAGYDAWAKGTGALSAGKAASARRWFERAVGAEPDDPVYRNWLGSAYYDAGRYDDAREQLVRAAQLDPDKAWYYYLGKSNLEIFWSAKSDGEARSARTAAEAAFAEGVRRARKPAWVDEMRRAAPILPELLESKETLERHRTNGDFVGAVAELERILRHYAFAGAGEELEELNRLKGKQLRREAFQARYTRSASSLTWLLALTLCLGVGYLLWYRRRPRSSRVIASERSR